MQNSAKMKTSVLPWSN